MMDYRADPAALQCLQVILFLFAGIFCAAAWCFLPHDPMLLTAAAAVILFAAVLTELLFSFSLRRIRCIVTSAQITVRSGIFFQKEQSVPLHSIQFVQVIHGPLNGKWGLNFILLHVCGSSLLLPFLRQEDGAEIKDFLRQKGVYHAP